MMDHYEELGVGRSAEPDEIRQAYKRLVRLLHPDHCSDAQVRPLADLQMKRLNGVLSTLTNPAERAIYDRATFGSPAPRAFPLHFPFLRYLSQWYGVAAGAAALLLMVFLLWHRPQSASRETATSVQPPTVSTAPAKKPVPQTRPHRLESRAPADEGFPRPGPVQFSSPGPVTNDAPLAPFEAHVAASPYRPIEIPAPATPDMEFLHVQIRPQLSGDWLFVPAPHPIASGLYPPEFIELRLTEESGILRGRYRARYHIPDQAISPAVSFQFEGKAGMDRATLPWSGAGGAAGEIRLKLVTPGALEVIWVATRLGGELGLISGTATLVRKLD